MPKKIKIKRIIKRKKDDRHCKICDLTFVNNDSKRIHLKTIKHMKNEGKVKFKYFCIKCNYGTNFNKDCEKNLKTSGHLKKKKEIKKERKKRGKKTVENGD